MLVPTFPKRVRACHRSPTIHLTILPNLLQGRTEGAAGSSWYTLPIIVSGHDRDGRSIRYEGGAVPRRVNTVDGASAAQRRWYFERLTLDRTH
ncbi:hypothetical protein ACNI3R_13445 [Rhizorhabdus sp. FW153]